MLVKVMKQSDFAEEEETEAWVLGKTHSRKVRGEEASSEQGSCLLFSFFLIFFFFFNKISHLQS